MNWFEQLLPAALMRALGWTLVHSLWQGAVVALALAGLLLLLRQHSAEVRYRTAAVGMLLLLTLSGITFGRYYMAAPTAASGATAAFQIENEAARPAAQSGLVAAAPASAATEVALAPAAPTGMAAWMVYFDENIPVLVAAWLLGLLAMTLRLLGGLAYVQRLRRYRVQPLAEEWQARLLTLANKAGLKQPIQLLESALVRTPVVVGHLRPVVLLPLGTVTGLSLTYMEAILAHELAHVQRRDYLMNLLQSVAETVFFYHPAVWFITACLRTERENCCDDVATALVGGNPLTVARALAALTELTAQPETANGRLALSALGPDGSVLGRIRRLVQGRTAPTFTEGFMAACVVLGGLVLLTSAVAIADPSPTAGTAGRGALSRLPFLSEETDTTRKPAEAELLPAEAPAADAADVADVTEMPELMESAPAPAAVGGDEEEKRRKRTRQQIVVVPQPGRNRSGTIVLEKDKKGRVTNFTVDGQRVEAATTGKKKSKKGDPQVEVVQLPGRRGPWNGSDNFSFNFDQTFDKTFDKNFNQNFRFQGPGLSKAEAVRIRAEAQRAAAEARRQFSENPQWRAEMNRSALSADKSLSIRLQALQSAERSLRNTLQDEKLTEEQREEIQDRLSDLRDQQQDARDEAQDRQDARDEARRDAAQEQQEIKVDVEVDMRRHEEEMRRHEVNMRRHDEEMRRADSRRVADEGLLRELRNDGLIKSTNNVQMTLTPTALTVNGKKQSAALHAKYLKLVEQRDGRKLTKGSFVMNRQTNGTTTTTGGDMPAPPAPPAAPRSPRAPRVPLPPAAPAAPRVDSDEVRAELRRDGLLGANEKAFQLQLTKDGLTVNGKKQSAALTEKYRKLLDAPDANGRNTSQTIQISVNE
ncbi:M56 family metallopeptidase [Hymenobacter perfusus]|uniref:Peptidase M56 domain-containing protein n=1 Tax=Hymenobacter perfusus TaxID=1236770 RepID=A0A428KHC3_9BACT|nr:M56 family metallopeptidase [Hymenobacter perfusus]RSK45758.1 hypothetical protein EI293_00885 [Hymenobacter perfusus]